MNRVHTLAIVGAVTLLFVPSIPAADTDFALKVKHDHFLKGSCGGRLVFQEDGIAYETEHEKHSRRWDYDEVQQLGLHRQEVRVLTYEDKLLFLGKDRLYEFELTEGEVPEELLVFAESRLGRPLVSEVLPSDLNVLYELPVRHRGTLKGSSGVLQISDDHLLYATARRGQSRVWRYSDLASLGSVNPFELRIGVMERTGGEFGGERPFVFDLKRRLSPEVYDFLWEKINRPKIGTAKLAQRVGEQKLGRASGRPR